MEVLLFALFFISALIFFISGKDDFGRTEGKLIIKGEEKVKAEKTFKVEGEFQEKEKEENGKKKEYIDLSGVLL